MVVAADKKQARTVMRYVRGFIQHVKMFADMVIKRDASCPKLWRIHYAARTQRRDCLCVENHCPGANHCLRSFFYSIASQLDYGGESPCRNCTETSSRERLEFDSQRELNLSWIVDLGCNLPERSIEGRFRKRP